MSSALLKKNREANNAKSMEDFEAMLRDDIITSSKSSLSSSTTATTTSTVAAKSPPITPSTSDNTTSVTATNDNKKPTSSSLSTSQSKTNWLRKATSNVIQQAKQGRNKRGQEPQPIDYTIEHSTSTSPSSTSNQKLWGINSSYNNDPIPDLTHDNFTFSPSTNFIPVSSCDDLPSSSLPTTTSNNNELKISSNFSKLIANSKRVDQVRNAQAQRKAALKQDKHNNDNEMTMIINSKDVNVESITSSESSDISVQQAQQKLIQQLKQGLDYLTNQNTHLSIHGDKLQKQIENERVEFELQLKKVKKEVEERNLKLAALEQHFIALNNPSGVTMTGNVTSSSTISATGSNNTTITDTSDLSSKQVHHNDDDAKDVTKDNDGSKDTSDENPKSITPLQTPENHIETIQPHTISSIVQIDKGYFTELEQTVKLQKKALDKLEKDNVILSEKVTTYTADLEKKERIIVNYEASLKQAHESRFKSPKRSNKRKSQNHGSNKSKNETVIFSTERNTPQSLLSGKLATPAPSQSDDEFSVSNASGSAVSMSVDEIEKPYSASVDKAIAEALAKQEMEHNATMDVLSRQLDVKDKIIQRHEMKIYDLLNRRDENTPFKQRHVPQDVLVRNIAVTNELMDTSIRKLEKMMEQLELVEKEKRTDLADEISPIRRVATKVSLVHEEMKVAIKLIEQKVKNDVEKVRQIAGDSDDSNNNSVEKSGQKSGEEDNAEVQTTIEDRIAEVLNQTMNTIRETEASIKIEIESFKEQLQRVEFELVGKQDTIEALELACSEHVQNCREMQEEIEKLKLGLMNV